MMGWETLKTGRRMYGVHVKLKVELFVRFDFVVLNRFPFSFSSETAAVEAPKTPTACEMQLSAPDINIIPSTPLATSPNVVLQQQEEEEKEKEEEQKVRSCGSYRVTLVVENLGLLT